MAQILDFDAVQRPAPEGQLSPNSNQPHRRGARPEPDEDVFTFWPEVSCGLWVSEQPPPAPDPANALNRVLAEMLVILGGAGLLVLLATAIFGAPQ
jgi:hypothetical protein